MTEKKRDLQAIFLDIDDTLYSTTSFAEKARRAALQAMIDVGLNMSVDELYCELLEVIEEFSANYGNHFDKLLDRIPQARYENINPAILVASAVVAYHERKFQELHIYPDVEEVLALVSKTSLQVGVITSGLTIKQAEKIIRLGLLPYLDPGSIFISDQVGINKPNVKLYQRALTTFSLEPHQALYVGDNPIKDVVPPNRLGMWTVWNRRGGKYDQEVDFGDYPPDFVIANFHEFRDILTGEFEVNLG